MTVDPKIGLLVAAPGPFASLYLGVSGQVDDAAADAALRWRGLRGHLAAGGADAATLDAVDTAVASVVPGDATLAVLAADGRVAWVRRLRERMDDRAVWGPLPCVLPLLAYRQDRVPCVVVHTDRTGADLRGTGDGDELHFAGEVAGPDDEIERNAPGGWSQLRYQHRAEDSWEHNAVAVADAVVGLADRVGAALIVLTGDVRAVQLLRKHLPARVVPLVRQLEHDGRRPGRGDELHVRQVRELIEAEAHARTADILARFAEHRAHGRAADGPAATLEALARARVQTLLVIDDPHDERTAWFGPGPTDVAADPGILADRFGPPAAARLADVAVRAAWGTGADVRVVPGDLPGGPSGSLGALLRYP